MHTPTHNTIELFMQNTNPKYLCAIMEAARIALADAMIADEISESMNMSDPEINNLQHQLHMLMKGANQA